MVRHQLTSRISFLQQLGNELDTPYATGLIWMFQEHVSWLTPDRSFQTTTKDWNQTLDNVKNAPSYDAFKRNVSRRLLYTL